MVLEPGLRVAVPHRVVQPGRALERQLAVQGRLDAAGEPGRGREQVGASTPPVRNFRCISRAASSSRAASQPCGGRPCARRLGVHRRRRRARSPSESTTGTSAPGVVGRGPPRRAARTRPPAASSPCERRPRSTGRLDGPGAAGDDEVDERRPEPRDHRGEVGDLDVADHEAADQVGVLRVAVGEVVGDRLRRGARCRAGRSRRRRRTAGAGRSGRVMVARLDDGRARR